MRAALAIIAVVILISLGAPATSRAQDSIAPCADCAYSASCFNCARLAQCCFYASFESPRCGALEGHGWVIAKKGIVDGKCFVSSAQDSNNEECYGPKCGEQYDPCMNGCEPGFGSCDGKTETTIVAVDLCGCCSLESPILVSLRGAGYHLSSADEGVLFDLNGLGKLMWVGWPTTADNGWLALDRNDNGRIDSGAELFGTATRLANGQLASNGYVALAELDANGDKWVDARDPAFARLRVWVDANRNGVSEPTELLTLSAAGIAALSSDAQSSSRRDGNGNEFKLRAKMVLTGGQERFSYDVFWTGKPAADLVQASAKGCSAAVR